MLFPQAGRDAKEERQDIIDSYPEFEPDRRQRILAADRDMFLYCLAAAEHWKEQKALAANVIRRMMGDAEFGFTGKGLVFVQRRTYPMSARSIPAGTVDALYKIKN